MPGSIKVTIPREAFERLCRLAELDERQLRLMLGFLSHQAGEGGDEAVAQAMRAELETVRSGRRALEGSPAETDARTAAGGPRKGRSGTRRKA